MFPKIYTKEEIMATIISNQAHVSFAYEGATEIKTNDSNIIHHTMRDNLCFSLEKSSFCIKL